MKLTSLWNKAGKLMQKAYRQNPRPCYGNGKSCSKIGYVLHHHMHWGQSIALRFQPINLIPLCMECHYAHHNGNLLISHNYRKLMIEEYGAGWEDKLFEINQKYGKKSAAETKYFLDGIIMLYKDKLKS